MQNKEISLAGEYAKNSRKIQNFIFSYGFYILFVLVLIFFGIKSPTFIQLSNFKQIFTSMTYVLIGACGAAVVVITGNMELSIGSIAIFAASIMNFMDAASVPLGVMLITSVLIGAVIGAINGFLITTFKMNSMLTTLGLQLVYRGIALILSNNGYYRYSSEFKNTVSGMSFLGFPISVWITIFAVIVLTVVMAKTRFGAYCYAVGCNAGAAKTVGVPVKKTLIGSFVICGMCAALCGAFYCMNVAQFDYAIGNGLEFTAIAAAVIGGTSLLGGRGTIFPGAFFGVALLYVINNGLTVIGASPFLYSFVRGLIIFLAMYVDSMKHFKKK
ncbi:MAG: ABC transporter permease [Christensenellales bacterium]|jgi:ribose/xylose/arabinose/galactoside ABC-type transport system permease subunit